MRTSGAWRLAAASVVALAIGAASGVAWGQDRVHAAGPGSAIGADPTKDAAKFREHLFALANPSMEGRAPGFEGNRRAADYLEWWFRRLGLEPAFPASFGAIPPRPRGENDPFTGERATFRQTFAAPRGALAPGHGVRIERQVVRWGSEIGIPGTDFAVMGSSGPGSATGPVVFAGYAIEEGDGGYRGFPEGSPALQGRIVMILRFEPVNEDGTSRWSSQRWSQRASLEPKLRAVVDRGAAAVILVNPPGARDERTDTLEGLGLGGNRPLEIPMVQMTPAAADRLVRAGDAQGRGLMDLRRLADAAGTVIELPRAEATVEVGIVRTPVITDNIGAILPGRGALANEFIVVGGHYDHVGYGYFGSRGMGGSPNPARAYIRLSTPGDAATARMGTIDSIPTGAAGVLHPGADDNASGTAGVLVMARQLRDAYAAAPPDLPLRSVLFLLFCAEESGLNGSRYYVNNPIAPRDKHYLMINLDMIGRLRTDPPLEIHGLGSGEGLAELAEPFIAEMEATGYRVIRRRGGQGPSDHASFDAAGIPVLFFHTGLHDQYHRPSDTAETINVEGGAKVATLASRMVMALAARTEPMPHTGRTRAEQPAGMLGPLGGLRVRFGIAPGDYSGDVPGVLVGDVFPGTSAEKAGLKRGDLITAWNGTPTPDVESWMPLLRQHKPGDSVTITYQRDGRAFTTTAELQGRQTGSQ